MRVWVIVPTCRKDMQSRVLGNFYSQQHRDKHLLVVENGHGVGTYSSSCHTVLVSDPHQSAAKNMALDWLQKNADPLDYWCVMDDDDYYSPHYVSEHVIFSKEGVIRGKRNAWVKFNDGLVYFGHAWQPNQEVPSLMGGTMGGFVKDAQRFDIRCAEERSFCDAARDAGLRVMTTTQGHYCYSREGSPREHAFQASEEKMWRYSGNAGVRVDMDVKRSISGDAPFGPAENFYLRGAA